MPVLKDFSHLQEGGCISSLATILGRKYDEKKAFKSSLSRLLFLL